MEMNLGAKKRKKGHAKEGVESTKKEKKRKKGHYFQP